MEYCVIGLGTFGTSVAIELQKAGHDVVAIDRDVERLKELENDVSYTLSLDATDEKALLEASINHFDVVIVGMGESSMTSSLIACLNLQSIGVEKIIAKAASRSHERILKKMGIENIIMPEKDMGRRVALKLQNNSMLDYIELSEDIRIEGYRADGCFSKYIDKSIIDINLRKKYNINIVSIKRGKELLIPDSETVIQKDDLLLIVGTNENLGKFERTITKE